jgi:hypothetical protein
MLRKELKAGQCFYYTQSYSGRWCDELSQVISPSKDYVWDDYLEEWSHTMLCLPTAEVDVVPNPSGYEESLSLWQQVKAIFSSFLTRKR